MDEQNEFIDSLNTSLDSQIHSYYDLINQQQAANNAWSAEQAQRAMDYQTEMSNTAHQREVADLKAAGLNPVLSAGGQGATTSTGHAASAGNENVTALYGLMNKQLDAQTRMAEAMINSAAHAGGYLPDVDTAAPFSFGIPILDAAYAAAKDFIKRKTGISQENTDAVVQSLSDLIYDMIDSDEAVDAIGALTGVGAQNAFDAFDRERSASEKSKTGKVVSTADKEKALSDKTKTQNISSGLSKSEKEQLAMSAAVAVAGLIGNSITPGGSAKRITGIAQRAALEY